MKFLITLCAISSTFFASAMQDKNELGMELIKAAQEGNLEEMQQLIAEGAGTDPKDSFRQTALMLAARNGQANAVKFLVAKGTYINATDAGGFTALIYAVSGDTYSTETIEFLIEKGIDIHARDETGSHALMFAAMAGHSEIVKLLIEKGVDIYTKTLDGWTGLMYAAGQKSRNPSCYEPLVEAMIAREKATLCFLLCHKKAKENKNILQYLPKDIVQLIAKEYCWHSTRKEINKITQKNIKQELFDKYFIEKLIVQEKERIYTFLNCLRLNENAIIKGAYIPCIIDSLKPYLRQMIDKSKKAILKEINKIPDDEINQNLLNKYFPKENPSSPKAFSDKGNL